MNAALKDPIKTGIFNTLQDAAGLEFFMTLFQAVLGDNGPEFSNPKMADNAILRKNGVAKLAD